MTSNTIPSSKSIANTQMHHRCFHILMDEGKNMEERYGVKLSKGKKPQVLLK